MNPAVSQEKPEFPYKKCAGFSAIKFLSFTYMEYNLHTKIDIPHKVFHDVFNTILPSMLTYNTYVCIRHESRYCPSVLHMFFRELKPHPASPF